METQDTNFSRRLANLRKNKGLTQHQLAELVGVQVLQIRRYESGACQPTLPIIQNLALALNISADELVFGKDARGPEEELRLLFEAANQFDPEEKKAVKSLLEGMLLKHQTKKLLALR